jgi:starch phosphorylase
LAELIIKFINNLAGTIDGDPIAHGRLKVVFLPNYYVSLAERLIPAADVSNQISTAGYEASGTSNMKFMMNGALTIGTRDGATIEMAEEAGEKNFCLFGLTADQVAGSRSWYAPHWHYDNEQSYLEADQRLTALYTDRDAWAGKAILNVAGSGKFSSDHTIAQYATEIWQAKPCPVA